ncbi:MAG: HEAT repeat domain-containing protein [Candidatus Omnitrophota bacterium]
MYDYHADIVWTVNGALFAALILTGAAIFLSALIKDRLWAARRKRLLDIKHDIYEMVLSGRSASPVSPPPFISKVTPQEFIDVETNRARDAVFFNDAEKQFLKSCFMAPEVIAKFERIAMRRGNLWRRIEAIISLGYTRTRPAEDTLGGLLYSKDAYVAYFAMISLGQIKTVRSGRMLLEFLRKGTSNDKKIFSILDGFPPQIADDIVRLTYDGDPRVRFWAAKLLSRFDAKKYADTLERLSRDGTDEVRAAACESLGNAGLRESARALIESLKDPSWLVKRNAVMALEKVMGGEAVPEVIGLIDDASWSVSGAVKDIMTTHVESALPYIEKFLAGKDEIAMRYSVLALEDSGYLARLLRDAASGKAGPRVMHLLEGIMKSGMHSGLEAVLGTFDMDTRSGAIKVLSGIDAGLADHIDKKIKGLIGEP